MSVQCGCESTLLWCLVYFFLQFTAFGPRFQPCRVGSIELSTFKGKLDGKCIECGSPAVVQIVSSISTCFVCESAHMPLLNSRNNCSSEDWSTW